MKQLLKIKSVFLKLVTLSLQQRPSSSVLVVVAFLMDADVILVRHKANTA